MVETEKETEKSDKVVGCEEAKDEPVYQELNPNQEEPVTDSERVKQMLKANALSAEMQSKREAMEERRNKRLAERESFMKND